MQAQQAISLPRRSYSTMIAVVATVVAGLLAVALVFSVERPVPSGSVAPPFPTSRSAEAEQIAHNRSEEGLGGSVTVGGEQIAHNRSEEGLTTP